MNGDALYQQYKDQYINQGKLAMQDTLGKASSLTGGYGNSYATTAGNQAYQGYLQQLNAIVPDLYNLAYNKYNQEGNEMRNNMSMYQSLADQWQADQDRLDTRANQLQSQGYSNWSSGYNSLLDNYNTAVKNAESAADKAYDDELSAEKLYYDQINNQNKLALEAQKLAVDMANKGLAYDESGNIVKVGDSGNGGGGKNPTSDMLEKALVEYNTKGESAMQRYVDSLVGYDTNEIYEYIYKYGMSPDTVGPYAYPESRELYGKKTPTQSVLDTALKKYDKGGKDELEKYVKSLIPTYDTREITKYVYQQSKSK